MRPFNMHQSIEANAGYLRLLIYIGETKLVSYPLLPNNYHLMLVQATITRSSQPMVGLTNSRSIQDEKLIEAIFQSHFLPESRGVAGPVYGATATNLIIDARPTTNAMANVAKGAGTENMDYYKEGKKAYLGIDNIHVMRDSLNKVVEAIREADAMAFTIGGDSDSGSTLSSSLLDRLALRRSGWLRHISAILDGTLLIVRNIHINSSHVLIHCSDGWDRTGQLSSLSQLCLDPFYRTVKGFQILIEKDWLSFGHRFLDRCGHLSSEKFFISATELPPSGGAEAAQALFASMQNRLTGHGHLKETSPVFHQFLECVRQIQRQYPERFEFNGRYLERIYYHLYSCQFGTFLFNCEKERRTGTTLPPPCERTHSIWDHLNLIEELEKNKNTSFDPSLDNLERRESKTDMGILYPDPKNVRFWNELYGRTDEEMNGKVPAVEAQGADSVGPIEGKRDDPVTASTAPEVPSVPSASSPQSVLLPEAESRSPSSSRIRPGSPRNSKTRIVSSSVPELPRRNSARSLIDATGMSASEVVTPKTNAEETPAISAHARLSPHLRPAPPQSDVLHERMRSVWGKFSSNASAAFTVVQGAYDGVTKELKGMAINQGWDSEETSADELRHQRRPHVPEGEGDWTSMVPSSTERSTPASSWAPDTVSPPDRWRTQSSSSKFSMLTLENPWGTTQPQREPSSPRRVDEIFSTTSVWSENDHHSPKPLSPSVAATERHAHSEGSDPLGVL